jgi:hypothetical protein
MGLQIAAGHERRHKAIHYGTARASQRDREHGVSNMGAGAPDITKNQVVKYYKLHCILCFKAAELPLVPFWPVAPALTGGLP